MGAQADRILVWYIPTLEGDNTTLGPVFVMDRDYRPRVVRIHSKTTNGAGNLEVDIKDDGTSIFTSKPTLTLGNSSEDVAEDFGPDADTIDKYSVVTLDFSANPVPGVTVQLELVAVEGEETDDTDT